MTVTHILFLPLPVVNNMPILNDPEIDSVDLDTQDSNGGDIEVRVNKNPLVETKRLIFKWDYQIINKSTNNELLVFAGNDHYDVTGTIDENYDYHALVKESHKRFRNHFDDLRLIEPLEELGQTEVTGLALELISRLDV